MKFDFSRKLCDLKGKEIPAPANHVEDIGAMLTLDGACYLALMVMNPQKPQDGVEKYKAYELYKKIQSGGEITAEDVVLLKEKIGDFWSQNVVGAAWDILEGKDVGQVAG